MRTSSFKGPHLERLPLAMLTSSLHQLEADLVREELDGGRHPERSAYPWVVFQCNDDADDRLSFLGKLFLHVAHVAQRLADDDIAGPSLLQLHDEQLLLVLADR